MAGETWPEPDENFEALFGAGDDVSPAPPAVRLDRIARRFLAEIEDAEEIANGFLDEFRAAVEDGLGR